MTRKNTRSADSATRITSKHTVRAYLKLRVDAGELGGKVHATAIAWLDEFLGRPALLKDLTAATLTAFGEWAEESASMSASARQNYLELLAAIARAAAAAEIIEFFPFRVDGGYKRLHGEKGMGLLEYFDSHYMPDRQCSDDPLSPSTLKTYRHAIESFHRFRSIALVSMINQAIVREFRRLLISRGMNSKKAANCATVVAQVVKHARPERFFEEAEELQPAADPTRALAYVFEKRYLPARQKIQRDATSEKYLKVFESFGSYLGHVATLDDFTDENVGAYMRDRRSTHENEIRTVNGYRSKLLAMWNWCARKRLVDEYPTIEKIPEPELQPVAWSVEELRQLLRGADRMPGFIAGIPAPDWWRTLHYVAWNTGERKGALLAMTWEMLDMRSAKVAVPAEFRKGGRKPMIYDLKPETLQLLSSIRFPDRALIFPFEPPTMFYHHYRRLLKLAGLPYVRYKSALQKMRRSFATHLEAAGGNATEAFQHSDRATTKLYLDPRFDNRPPANRLLFTLEPMVLA